MAVATEDCHGVVGVDRNNGKGTFVSHLGLITMGTTATDADLVSDLEVVGFPASILADESFVDLALTQVVQRDEVCEKRDVKTHVSVEHNSTR